MRSGHAPIKSVSGQPFYFETQVGALMMLNLLSGLPFDVRLGPILAVKFHQRSAGWGGFDDLVLECRNAHGTSACGLSLKTDRQLSRTGVNPELGAAAWDFAAISPKNALAPEHRWIGLICTVQARDVSKAFTALLQMAASQSSGNLEIHVRAGEGQRVRSLHDSFAPPPQKDVGAMKPGNILSKFLFQEYDFDQPTSKDEAIAVQRCRSVLARSDNESAQQLWHKLLQLADECRLAGGDYDLARLVGALRSGFPLKEHPDLSPFWARFKLLTALNLETTRDTIAGHHLDRPDQYRACLAGLEQAKFLMLEGNAGNGKSALAARLVREWEAAGHLGLYLRAGELESQAVSSLVRESELSRAFSAVHAPVAVLCVDGVQACRTEASWNALSQLLRACHLERSDSPWRVIVTCLSVDYERVVSELTRRVAEVLAQVTVVHVDSLAKEEVFYLLDRLPRLSSLKRHARVLEILRNAKVLELVAARLSAAAVRGAEQWIGEISVVEWWWREVVSEGRSVSERSRSLIYLATRLAAESLTELPATSLPGDLDRLDPLIAEDVLAESDGRLRFAHDLYADWTRLRALLELEAELPSAVVERACMPGWQHAIRLLGMRLLDDPAPNRSWHKLFSDLPKTGDGATLAIDLLLEAAVFTADPVKALESLWPTFASEQGKLLKRFLARVQHSATVPDAQMFEYARTQAPKALPRFTAQYRRPYAPLWGPLLDFIFSHLKEALALDLAGCSQIAKLWLELAVLAKISGQPAARIAIEAAREVARSEMARFGRVESRTAKAAYEALLLAARDFPDEVSNLVLKLVGRRRWDLAEVPPDADPEYLGIARKEPASIIPADEVFDHPPQAWPDGPTARTLPHIQSVLLESPAALTLLNALPENFSQALLAALISWPRSRLRNPPYGMAAEHHGFQYVDEAFPPRYWKTPFLLLLRRDLEVGLRGLVRLVDFATERAIDRFWVEGGPSWGVEVEWDDKRKRWLGDWRMFHWHRYPLITIDTVGSALMALEKWMYDELEAGRSVDAALTILRNEAQSLAFPGVLVTVAKRFPALFLGPLRSFVFSLELFHLDLQSTLQLPANGPQLGEARWQEDEVRAWETMGHRRLSLHDLCIGNLLSDPHWGDLLTAVRETWRSASARAADEQERLKWLRWAAKFDAANWAASAPASDGTVQWNFTSPEELRDIETEALLAREQMLLKAPFECRRLLDEGTQLPCAQLEQLWSQLQAVVSEDSAESSTDEAASCRIVDAVGGAIAVLVVLHRDWLNQHPDRLRWCQEKLLDAAACIQPNLQDLHEELGELRFDDFAASALVELWTSQPDLEDLRSGIARIVLGGSKTAIATLCSRSFRQRRKLGHAWLDLQALTLRWSVARLHFEQERYRPNKTFDFEQWATQWLVPFLNGSIAVAPSAWEELSRPWPRPERRQHASEAEPLWPDLDLEYLIQAFFWCSALTQATDEAERSSWIDIGSNFFRAMLRRLATPLSDSSNLSGVPSRTDLAVFRFVAQLLVELRDEEDPGRLWQPVFELGPGTGHWIQMFLTEFLIVGLRPDEVSPRFMQRWKEMLGFALTSPKWTSDDRWVTQESWEHLLGTDSVTMTAWAECHRLLVDELKSFYWRWVDKVAHDASSLLAFLRFLQNPAAAHLACEAIEHLAPALDRTSDYSWQTNPDRSVLSGFAGFLWSSSYEDLRRSARSLQVFRFMVAKLATLHDPLALEIMSKLEPGDT